MLNLKFHVFPVFYTIWGACRMFLVLFAENHDSLFVCAKEHLSTREPVHIHEVRVWCICVV